MTEEEKNVINKVVEDAKAHNKNLADYGVNMAVPFKLYDPVGCEKCNMTGFKGQIGIFEAIYNDENIEAIIPKILVNAKLKKYHQSKEF